MPRQAHGRSVLAKAPSKTRKRKGAQGRGLNALETAERQFPEQVKIRQHRLGQAEDDDDEPQSRQDADERSAKRRKVDVADEASEDGGSDPDGNEWHVGVEDDDEDSDIDSDEAFGDSDEERFADFTFRGSENPKSKPRTSKASVRKQKRVNRSEGYSDDDDKDMEDDGSEDEVEDHDDEDDDDSLGEDAIDLAAAWDLDDAEEKKAQEKAAKKAKAKQRSTSPELNSSDVSAESASESDHESDVTDNENLEDISDDGFDEQTNARLRSFVDGLTPAEKTAVQTKNNRPVKSLADKPSQYGLGSAGLSAADLMQYVKDPTQRQSLKIVQAAEKEDGSYVKGAVPGKLAVPLAKRQQDRLDRLAAYDKTKTTVDRWVDTVKQNRRAEHVSFPLLDPTKASASGVKNLRSMARAEPQTELESKIQQIMQESGLSSAPLDAEGPEQEYEQLAEKKIPLDELQARRRELRMQRELMFREEVRAKRIKKIKSKAYRRVHRKERDKETVKERERLEAAGLLNSEDERERADRKRAEERMGARHKESKWAKAAKATGQTVWNEDAKAGVSELARRDDELRRRVEGKTIRDSDASSSSESEYSDTDGEEEGWNEKLKELSEPAHSKGKSKLADMAFMRKAEAERKAQNDEELRLLKQAVSGGDDQEANTDSEDDYRGRQRFGNPATKSTNSVQPKTQRREFEAKLSEDEVDNVEDEDTSNTQQKIAHSSTSAVVFKNTNPPDTSAKTNGSSAVVKNAPQITRPSAAVAKTQPRSKAKAANSMSTTTKESALDNYTSPSESENDLDDKNELALGIFAGDDEEDLRKQFQKEKKKTVKEEGDQVIDNSLPGWGSWTGAGVSKREQNKAKGRSLTTVKGIAAEARKDAKLDKVIINEKRVKKNGKYLATELPHPFESRQQYERALRLPMGPEWSTRNHFQDAIKPRVLVKQGHVIKPMSRPTV